MLGIGTNSVFGYENKEKHPIYVSKKCYEEKHADLLLTGEEEKRHYVLIKDFNTFMYDHKEEENEEKHVLTFEKNILMKILRKRVVH